MSIENTRARLYEELQEFKKQFKTVEEAIDNSYKISVMKELFSFIENDDYVEEFHDIYKSHTLSSLALKFFKLEHASIDSFESIADFLRGVKP